MKTHNELIEQYYRENPEVEVKHRRSQIGEVAAPIAIGAGIGATGLLRIPNNAMAGAGAGIFLSAPIAAVRRAHRRKKILREMGVDESILGSFMEPIKREI